MADQVNLVGSLGSGLPALAQSTVQAKPAPDKAPASSTDNQPSGPDRLTAPGTVTTPENAVAHINSHLQQAATDLKIQVDKGTGRTVFKVVDEHTGQTVLQVPSEEVLAMARNLRSLNAKQGSSGVLVDKQG